jgi:prepilin-type N-terminal cleavage/methylation domain-containing protein
MQNKKGFTIIELVVVIAIIAVLSAIVMINVTGYIGKSKDAAIRGDMQAIATTAAGYYDQFKTVGGMFPTQTTGSNTTINNAISQILSYTGTATAGYYSFWNSIDSSGNFCACAHLSTGNYYCVDASGYRGETATSCTTRCATANNYCAN